MVSEKIESIHARMIFDSRGNPTVEVELRTTSSIHKSSCPSGASTGSSEACELRDGGEDYHGKGVKKVIENINDKISKALVGKDPTDQFSIDKIMKDLDGTENKSNLGANAILPVSMAVCRAGAHSSNLPLYSYISKLFDGTGTSLPYPCFNIINGGEHAGNNICIQEFMICPVGAKSFEEAMKMASETYHTLRSLLKRKIGICSVNVGDEGGFAPVFPESEDSVKEINDALKLIEEAIEKSGYKEKIRIGMDAAASEFFKEGFYVLDYKKNKAMKMTKSQLISFYQELKEKYNLLFIEDPLDENDWEGFSLATSKLKIDIIGDDLLTTNPSRIKKAIEKNSCNALLLKLNQIGTVSEAIEAAKIAKQNNWKIMTSHRSGETADDFIADLAVGLGTEYIKSGAPCRGERLAKYNRLLEIEMKDKNIKLSKSNMAEAIWAKIISLN